jgi:hypothetical protein
MLQDILGSRIGPLEVSDLVTMILAADDERTGSSETANLQHIAAEVFSTIAQEQRDSIRNKSHQFAVEPSRLPWC